MSRYTLEELENLPTLSTSQSDNLKIETAETRVWLARTGIADGEPYNHRVSIERYNIKSGRWETVEEYPAEGGDEEDEDEE